LLLTSLFQAARIITSPMRAEKFFITYLGIFFALESAGKVVGTSG